MRLPPCLVLSCPLPRRIHPRTRRCPSLGSTSYISTAHLHVSSVPAQCPSAVPSQRLRGFHSWHVSSPNVLAVVRIRILDFAYAEPAKLSKLHSADCRWSYVSVLKAADPLFCDSLLTASLTHVTATNFALSRILHNTGRICIIHDEWLPNRLLAIKSGGQFIRREATSSAGRTLGRVGGQGSPKHNRSRF